MKKGDVITCRDIKDLGKVSIALKEAGEKFDVIVDQDAAVYKILIIQDRKDEE